jgi:hypothetical protein
VIEIFNGRFQTLIGECRGQLLAYTNGLGLYGYVGNLALSCLVVSFELPSLVFELGAAALIGSVAASSSVAHLERSVSLKLEVAGLYVQFGVFAISFNFRLRGTREKH